MRFGVVGTNFISKEFVRAGQTLPGFVLAAICSRKQETAEAFAAPFGGASCCVSLDSMLALPDVDAVYIASPNSLHDKQAEAALRAHKHVLLEKPACLTAARFHELTALAAEKGVVLLEAMRPVFTPGVAALKKALPLVGTVRRASLTYCQYSSRYDKFKRGIVENAFDPSLGNGALMDIGVYGVHLLVALFGRPARVYAAAQLLPNGLDGQGGVLCQYHGMLADVSYAKIADGRRENEIQGEAGTLVFDPLTNPKRIRFYPRDGQPSTLYHDPADDFFGMEHEIAAFMGFAASSACGDRPWAVYNGFTQTTLLVMDEIRRQTGVDFVRKETESKGDWV